jgi:hypothetical protein
MAFSFLPEELARIIRQISGCDARHRASRRTLVSNAG